MKNQLTFIFFLFLILILNPNSGRANNYYYSSSQGNDNYSEQEAQSRLTPWRTLNKLNLNFITLRGGDTIFFKCGDIFNGTIIATASGNSIQPIVLTSYGVGEKPVINGFSTLNTWANAGNNIWEANTSPGIDVINMLTWNDKVQAIGRYPNKGASNGGYLTLESFAGSTAITDNDLPSSPDWTGSEIVIRKNRWVLDRNKVSQQNGNTIQYISESGYPASANYGYFFQNDPKTLDRAGEWFHDTNQNKIGIYSVVTPSVIEASTIPVLVSIINQHYLTFNGLCFKGANEAAFDIKNSGNIEIDQCDIFFSGNMAINAAGSNNMLMKNCLINHTNNIAISMSNCSNALIYDNTISNTGVLPGMGKGDSGSYEAILISGNNNTIEFNRIDSTGYIPVTFSGNSVTVKNNFITNFGFVKDDGGGVYTWNNGNNAPDNTNRLISGNIILNGIGAGEGTDDPQHRGIQGIYIDDNSSGLAIEDNTISNCGQYGIYLHNARNILLRSNTSFNNHKQVGFVHDNIAPDAPISNITNHRNIFFSKQADQSVADYKTINNDLNSFGDFDSNYYCRPLEEQRSIFTSYQENNSNHNNSLDLEEWQANFSKDLQSRKTPVQIVPYAVQNLTGNNKYPNGNFTSGITGAYVYSAAGNCQVTWANNSILDGGALKVHFINLTGTTGHASLIIGIGEIQANKNYILRFSMAGTGNDPDIEIFLRKSLAGYNDLSERKFRKNKPVRTENEILFTSIATETDASIVFDIAEQPADLFFDNIKLYEANVLFTDPGDSIRFEYNATRIVRHVALNATYIDPKSRLYAGSLVLEPFTSRILIKYPLQLLPSRFLHFSGKNESGSIALEWKIGDNTYPSDFIVERAADGNAFNSVGRVLASNISGTFIYRFNDQSPEAGNNHYRIKQITGTGETRYSNAILINFIWSGKSNVINIHPNPAINNLTVTTLSDQCRDTANLNIRSATGILLKQFPLSDNNMTFDISFLSTGIYIAEYICGKTIVRKKFIKY